MFNYWVFIFNCKALGYNAVFPVIEHMSYLYDALSIRNAFSYYKQKIQITVI